MRRLEHFPNLIALFLARATERGDAPFLIAKQDGRWAPISWRETLGRVAALAASLQRLGLVPGERVLLVSENRPEWCIADLAIMAAGGITVPAYATNTTRDHEHVLSDSGAAMAIVSSAKLGRVLVPAMLRTGGCRHLISIEPLRAAQSGSFAYHEWADLVAPEGDPGTVRAAADRLGRSDTACLIYTSGTGGSPRGVMQHHGAILHNIAGASAIIAEDFGWGEERFLSFLPLSHAYEHSGGQFLPIALGAEIAYAEGLDKLSANIAETQPTIMVVVPRLFEVLRQRMLRNIEKEGRLALWLLERALGLARRELAGRSGSADAPLRLLLDATLRRKVKARLGGRLKAMVSGGAPLNPEVGTFFHALGVTLLQGYGQTEAGPVIACNRPACGIRMETVGPPLAGVELRIAEDGEILVRGELVMHGYWRNPEETARAIDAEGWLHTGDIGELDEAGRLRITDRKKDLIVNDKGDNVAPQRVEGMLTLEPEILQAMVVGDRRPHLVGLVVPDPEWRAGWAAAHGMADDPEQLRSHPEFGRAIQAAVDRVNKGLSVTEKVRRVLIADEAFGIENGQLTPSLKIRRHVIRAAYGERLDALYGR